MKPQTLTILGSTGTIGVNTLRVVADHPGGYRVHALTAHNNSSLLAEQCRRFRPRYAVLAQGSDADALQRMLQAEGIETEVGHGAAALA